MSDAVTVETGMNATTTQHSIVSSDGKGHDKITVRAGLNATMNPTLPQPQYAPTPREPWLPQNFKTPQDLVKSYQELQASFTKKSQELAALGKAGAPSTPATTPVQLYAPTDQPAPVAASPTTPTPAPATETVVSSPVPSVPTPTVAPEPVPPVDLQALSAEWAKNGGKLTATSIARLAKQGIDERAINLYIEAQTALAEKHTKSIAVAAGGEDRLPLILQWAAAGNAARLADRYNMFLATGDFEGATITMAAMSAAYTNAVGYDPRLAIGGVEAGRIQSEEPFMSQAEMVRGMSDKRYGKDPAYTRSVERRSMQYAALKQAGKAF